MTKPEKIAVGGFADIWDLKDGTVLKAYRIEARAHGVFSTNGSIPNVDDHNLLTRVFCFKEINAYKLLLDITDIKEHIPKFYEQVDPISLVGITGSYVKDAGFIIEKLEGKDKKISCLSNDELEVINPVLSKIKRKLVELNVHDLNVHDLSCFYESKEKFKLIDFALWDSASNYECSLTDGGEFDNTQRARLNEFLLNKLQKL